MVSTLACQAGREGIVTLIDRQSWVKVNIQKNTSVSLEAISQSVTALDVRTKFMSILTLSVYAIVIEGIGRLANMLPETQGSVQSASLCCNQLAT